MIFVLLYACSVFVFASVSLLVLVNSRLAIVSMLAILHFGADTWIMTDFAC